MDLILNEFTCKQIGFIRLMGCLILKVPTCIVNKRDFVNNVTFLLLSG